MSEKVDGEETLDDGYGEFGTVSGADSGALAACARDVSGLYRAAGGAQGKISSFTMTLEDCTMRPSTRTS